MKPILKSLRKKIVFSGNTVVYEMTLADFNPPHPGRNSSRAGEKLIGKDNLAPPLIKKPKVDIELIKLDKTNIHELKNLVDGVVNGLSSGSERTQSRSEYQRLVKKGHECYLGIYNGKIVHTSWVFRNSKACRILGGKRFDLLIGECFTIPEMRGNGIYPYVLACILRSLKSENISKVLIDTHPDNISSMRGIEKVGFKKDRIVSYVTLLTTLVIRKNLSLSDKRMKYEAQIVL